MNVLVLSTFDGRNASVIGDFLFSFNAYSRHRYYYVFDGSTLGGDFDFSPFDVILIFWSLYLLGSDLAPEARAAIRAAPAAKVLFLQDEYRDVRSMNAVMRELGIRAMFTNVAEADHETFYPRSLIPTLEATYTVLTGYVPAYLEGLRSPPAEARPYDVGYRSREVPFCLGDLAREKRIIADRFQRICADHGLRADLSVREADRLYGSHWIDFLRRSRCSLGTASGASVVDLTGEIRRRSEVYAALHPDASYEDVRARFFADVDGKLVIETVSPRVFEAAALHSTLVHHEGNYAGLLEPDRHYIQVKRDYSNVTDVVDRIRDHGFCRELAANAHRDLVASGRHSYRAFVRQFDERLARLVPAPVARRAITRAAFYGRRYRWYQRLVLPRRDRFVVIPSLAAPVELLGRAIVWASSRRLPMVSRFLLNPGRFAKMGRVAARLILKTPYLRAVLWAHVRDGGPRTALTTWRLADDLLKIDIVRRARGGRLRSRQPFRIETELDLDTGILKLSSHPAARPASRPSSANPVIEQALHEGRVRLIVWDHTAVGVDVAYEISPGRWLRVNVGGSGLYRFDALSAICRRSPSIAAPALVTVLHGGAPDARGAEAAR